MRVLIDADVLVYESCFAAQTIVNWGDDLWSVYADAKQAQLLFEERVVQILDAAQVSDYVLAVSDEVNFRTDVLETYKGNRKGKLKPCAYVPLRNWVRVQPQVQVMYGLEADDVMGILQTQSKDTIICTIDKDLRQIPGLHLDLNNLEAGVFEVPKEEADQWHWVQTIAGDAVDGYGGVPGLGPVRAKALLDKKGYEWPVVVEAYASKGLSEEYALKIARVARILRDGEYDHEARRPVLWNP